MPSPSSRPEEISPQAIPASMPTPAPSSRSSDHFDGPKTAPAGIEPSWIRQPGDQDTTLEDNWLFRLRRQRYRSRLSGKTHDFYIIDLASAVHVIALTPDSEVLLVRQFRAGSEQDSLETPGGLLEPEEDPRAAGARELLEETGYAGEPAELLGTLWSNPSLVTSRISTVLIRNARKIAEASPDHSEELEVLSVPAADIPNLILDGTINHALVVAGLLWWLALPSSPTAPGG